MAQDESVGGGSCEEAGHHSGGWKVRAGEGPEGEGGGWSGHGNYGDCDAWDEDGRPAVEKKRAACARREGRGGSGGRESVVRGENGLCLPNRCSVAVDFPLLTVGWGLKGWHGGIIPVLLKPKLHHSPSHPNPAQRSASLVTVIGSQQQLMSDALPSLKQFNWRRQYSEFLLRAAAPLHLTHRDVRHRTSCCQSAVAQRFPPQLPAACFYLQMHKIPHMNRISRQPLPA
jgi:hypothetical protein